MAAAAKKREARKSVQQPGWITLDGGFAARPCVVQDLSSTGAKVTVDDGNVLPGRLRLAFSRDARTGRTAKWSRTAARPSASNSSASAVRPPAIEGGMRNVLLVIAVTTLLPAWSAAAEPLRQQKSDKSTVPSRQYPPERRPRQ